MKFFNPFGPYILQSNIDEESRITSLELIHKLDEDIKAGIIEAEEDIIRVGGTQTDDRVSTYQENSISTGTMNAIPSSVGDSIIGYILHHFTNEYFKHHELLNPFCDDSGTLFKHKNFTDCKTHESVIIGAWFVMMEEGDFHILHNHNMSEPFVTVSGAIYLDIPENIKPPQGNLNFILDSHDAPLHNSNWSIAPKNGDVYIWPAWLRHFVYPFRSKEKRIMISFNAGWKEIDVPKIKKI